VTEGERLTLVRRLLLTASRRRGPALKARLLERARVLIVAGWQVPR